MDTTVYPNCAASNRRQAASAANNVIGHSNNDRIQTVPPSE